MTNFSSVPALAVALGVTWTVLAARSTSRKALRRTEFGALALWALAMAGWGALSASHAIGGDYRTEGFLRSLPGFWLPFIPVGFSAAFLAAPAFRSGLFKLFAANHRAFVLLQGLRVLAIGGVTKGLTGHLPPSFALPIGIPDFLFGLSALWLGLRMAERRPAPATLIAWNLVGVAVILPAPFLMQMGMPGPLYTFMSQPDARALLDYPMALAPTLIVPTFITLNAMHAAVLWLQSRGEDASSPFAKPVTPP